jgi:hypothetical protein
VIERHEIAVLMKAVGGVVKKHVGAAIESLSGRLNDFDQRISAIPAGARGERGEKGDAGRDAEPLDTELFARQVIERIPAPRDGKDAVVDMPALARDVLALIPVPRDGRDGKDADPEVVRAIMREEVERSVTVAAENAVSERVARDAKSVIDAKEFSRRVSKALGYEVVIDG